MIDPCFIMTNCNASNAKIGGVHTAIEWSQNETPHRSHESGRSSPKRRRRFRKTLEMAATSCTASMHANHTDVTEIFSKPPPSENQINQAQIVQAPRHLLNHPHQHGHQSFLLDGDESISSASFWSSSSSNEYSNIIQQQQQKQHVSILSMSNRQNGGSKTRHRKRHGNAKMVPFKFGVNSMILLALFLILLPNCLALLFKLPNIKTTLASTTNNLEPSTGKLYHRPVNDDGDSDLPMATQMSRANSPDDTGNSAGDAENFTPIPSDYNNNKQFSASLPTTTQRPLPAAAQAAGARRPPILRVTESELLPFNEFNVQQPTFSDLIKSWPPITQQAAQAAIESGSPAPRYAVGSRQNPRVLQPKDSYDSGAANGARSSSESASLMRNYLNEDLDDTMATADQGFERDQVAEPPTMINYLGDLGDYIYVQLRQYFEHATAGENGSRQQPPHRAPAAGGQEQPDNEERPNKQAGSVKIETIDEMLDDHYYDQYENSQVLYYGPQLVRQGDIFEIGCYLPNDQRAEWTKSGRPLAERTGGSPRVVRRGDFLGAKQNYSLKIFEASLSDSGNYRCNRLSRKYHKLVVVPLKTTTTQLFVIQQRLLSVVNPKLVSVPQLAGGSAQQTRSVANQIQRYFSALASGNKQQSSARSSKRDYLLPAHLIVENQPLVVNCNITDEFVLRKLAENPKFQLAWYKNGKQLKGSMQPAYHSAPLGPSAGGHSSASAHHGGSNQSPGTIKVQVSPRQLEINQQQQLQANSRARQQQPPQPSLATGSPIRPLANNQRIQFLLANGRQLYITSALYSDAGDYLCSWAKLPAPQPQPDTMDETLPNSEEQPPAPQPTIAANPLAAGSLVQLMAPVKLRPFKSTYHVRAGNELRLVCQLQRGYPAAHVSWYVGNRLVDGEFLREHGDEFRVMQLQNQNQLIVTSAGGLEQQTGAPDAAGSGTSNGQGPGQQSKQIVEINPIPSGRQQMSMTANGRGQWIEYRDPRNEKYAIETAEQQLRYLKQKLAQLTGFNSIAASSSSSSSSTAGANQAGASSSAPVAGQPTAAAGGSLSSLDPQTAALFGQTSVSVLVINSLDIDRHTARYACRATTRTNTDEATTVIRVQASSTVVIRPTSGRATLVPGQPLHFQCEMIGSKNAEFLWHRRLLGQSGEVLLEPNNDDTIEIHNERLTLLKPTLDMAGDYICRPLGADQNTREYGLIRVRAQPYIEDFGPLPTSHTGKSSTIMDGDRLELICTVRDKITPVNITWLRSKTPDDDRTMEPLTEIPVFTVTDTYDEQLIQTIVAKEQSIIVETLNDHSKRLLIESIRPEHRSHYGCIVDNGVTEKTRKVIFIRVKDKLVALWPFLGIVAELFILFTIIHVWETQRAYREMLFTQQAENRLLQ